MEILGIKQPSSSRRAIGLGEISTAKLGTIFPSYIVYAC